jgi:hypothetical protein
MLTVVVHLSADDWGCQFTQACLHHTTQQWFDEVDLDLHWFGLVQWSA